MTDTKQAIIDALRAFIRSRPGFEPGNYSDAASYRADVRRATKQRHDAERMLRDVEMRDSITAEDILRAAESGRLAVKTVSGVTDLKAHVHYTAGQYYCTEFRGAVARLLASVLWRARQLPTPTSWQVRCIGDSGEYEPATRKEFATEADATQYADTIAHSRHAIVGALHSGMRSGDWLRASFRREYGRGMAERYFN